MLINASTTPAIDSPAEHWIIEADICNEIHIPSLPDYSKAFSTVGEDDSVWFKPNQSGYCEEETDVYLIANNCLFAYEENVEDLMAFIFPDVEKLVCRYKNAAVEATSRMILNGKIEAIAAKEIIKCLGYLVDDDTFHNRRVFFQNCLFNQPLEIKDAALSALSYLNSKKCLPSLLRAHEKETDSFIKKKTEKVIEYLNKA